MLVDLLGHVAPVLVFLVAISVVAELSDRAGVFTAAGDLAARLARGRTLLLWLLVVALATAATIVLSLDTTAVLLTPVVLSLALRLGLPAAGLAMTTVWLANSASLLLPVSNLTNLLSLHRMRELDVDVTGYVRLTWLPAIAAVAVTVALLALMFRRDLTGKYPVPTRVRPGQLGFASDAPADPVLLRVSAAVCLLLGPAFVSGVPVAWSASVAAAMLCALFAWRRPAVLTPRLVPLRLVALVLVLFVVVRWLTEHVLTGFLVAAAGQGEGFLPFLRLAAVAALGSNGVNNLPAYVALEPVAQGSPARLVALLIGVNTGPLITLWASLATLLWRERCRAAGVPVSTWGFAARGLVLVPALLVACTAALAVTAASGSSR
jgi:arsenical pump membrane protein